MTRSHSHTESICRAETLPSSAPHPPCALHTEVLRAAFILQLLLSTWMLARVWPLCGMWNTFSVRISASPHHPVRWGKYCCPHFTDEETNVRSSSSLAQPCITSKGQSWDWNPRLLTLRFSGFFPEQPNCL